MTGTLTYRCLNCREQTLEREYDVSHLSITCETCGEFSRFVHEGVYQQFEDFEESPPDDIAWGELDRMQKFMIAEGLVRSGKTLDDFDITPDTSE